MVFLLQFRKIPVLVLRRACSVLTVVPSLTAASAGSVTNMYGIYTAGGNSSSVGGTVTNYYSAFLATPSKTGTMSKDYGLYQKDNTATNYFAGNLGIGTSTPYSLLEIWGPDSAASTTAFLVANSASTTEFAVLDNGNATLAGNLIQNSDQRLKTNVQTIDATSSLASIRALNPVDFNWVNPDQGSQLQYGFIAQQIQSIFPNLVSTTSPTSLTPDGTLSLNYVDLIAPIVAALQELRQRDHGTHSNGSQLRAINNVTSRKLH